VVVIDYKFIYITELSMDDRTTHDDGDQLFDTEIDDGDATPANDTEEDEEILESEQEQDDLDLDDEEQVKTSKAEENKQKQVAAWKRKIESGDSTIDDLPTNLGWLKGDIEKALEVKKAVAEADIKSLLREEIKAEKETIKFQELQDDLNSALNADQKVKVSDAYKRLRSKGLSKLDSVEMAMEVAGINLDDMGVDARRSRMAIPSPGRSSSTPKSMDNMPWGDVVKNFSKEQRQEYLRKQVS